MKYLKFIAALAFLVAGLTVSLPAQAKDDSGGVAATTEYNFEDDLVTGDLVRPDGELVGARRKAHVTTLIRVRKTFIPEMLKTVENL